MHQRPVIIVALLTMALLVALIVPAQTGAQADGFQETFDDPNLPGWEHPPEATVVDGVLQVRPGGFALHFGDWTNISLTIKVRFSGEGEALIRYYFREEGHYNLSLSPGTLSLQKEQSRSSNTLGSAVVPELLSDTWVNIKVTVSGDQQQVYVNDELQLTVTDPEPLSTGAILLTTQGGLTAEFDDLDVRGTFTEGRPPEESAPPPEGEPAASPTVAEAGALPAVSSGAQSGLEGFIEEFFASQANALDLTTFLINLLLAAVCAYILGLVYIHWGSSLTNRRRFAANFMLLTITTTFIILVVRSSVALSLGLVGALSIVRFRTAVKEPEELAYLFVAIGIGIGLGDNQRLITLLALAAVLVIIFLQRIFRLYDADVNLHLSVTSHNPNMVELNQIMSALRPHVMKMKLMRFDETADALEAAFLIEFGRIDRLNEARSALKALSESIEITFMDNKGLW